MVRCLQRQQGLILSHAFDDKNVVVESILNDSSIRWAQRNADSGSERLLEDLCVTNGCTYQSLRSSTTRNTECSAVAAVNTGAADVTCGTQATAYEFQLPFLPFAEVAIDMVMTRRTYFRTLTQTLLNRLLDDSTFSIATQMGGYKLSDKLDVIAVE